MNLEVSEKKVQELIARERKSDAVKLLAEMVRACAKARKFQRAEEFRKQIMEVDPLALNEIISSAEIIESEKARAVDLKHKKIWAVLYDTLSDDEAIDFYFSLKKIKLGAGKMIIEQGRVNNRLFLPDSGLLKVVCEQGKSNVFVREISKGYPAGFNSFFSISYATATVITGGPVTLHYLQRDAFKKLVEKFPGIESRLESRFSDFIEETTAEILKRRSLERRGRVRFPISGKAEMYVLDTKGETNKPPVKGILEDISEGGAAFSIRQAKKESARLFLGRLALLHIQPGSVGDITAKKGRVTGVHNLMFGNYLVNFKFIKPLLSHQVATLVETGPRK